MQENHAQRLQAKKTSGMSPLPNGMYPRGQVILQLAESLYPALLRKMKDYRDAEDRIVQPARIRGIALIVAQELVKSAEAAAA